MYINANKIYYDAVRWAQEVKSDNRVLNQSQALVSIIYAPMSIETFMNEIVYQAEMHCLRFAVPSLQTFTDVLNEMEQSKAPSTSKMQMGKFILTGEQFDKGKNPFQDFALLIKLRNEIIHQKAHEEVTIDETGNFTVKRRSILEPFKGRNLLGKTYYNEQEALTNWLDEISTREMAFWACSAAAGMVLSILDATLTTGHFGKTINHIYRAAFSTAPHL